MKSLLSGLGRGDRHFFATIGIGAGASARHVLSAGGSESEGCGSEGQGQRKGTNGGGRRSLAIRGGRVLSAGVVSLGGDFSWDWEDDLHVLSGWTSSLIRIFPKPRGLSM